MLTFHLSIRQRLLVTWSHLETLLPQVGSECGACWLERVAWDQPPEAVGGHPHTYVPPPTLHTSARSFTEKLFLKIVNDMLGGVGKLLNTWIRCTL